MIKVIRLLIPVLIFGLISCEKEYKLSDGNSEHENIFSKLPEEQTGITFSNELQEDMRYNGLQYEYYYNGSGLAVSDFNNDGLKDIFLYRLLTNTPSISMRADLNLKMYRMVLILRMKSIFQLE